MPECNHNFIGTASGVTCQKCGLKMTGAEFVQFLKGENPEKPKPKKKTDVKSAK